VAILNPIPVSQHRHGAARSWLFAVLAGAVLAACSKPAPTPTSETASAKPPMAQSQDDSDHHNDPCSLLQTSEVEGALAAPLGTPPYRGGSYNPAPGSDDCTYQTTNFQTVTLSVDWDGGQQAYHIGDFAGNAVKRTGVLSDKAKQAMVSEDGSTIGGEWDEAKLTPFNCCIFNALRADQMISIDFTGSMMTLKAAAALVDAALKRMEKPLSLDGGANVAAAKTFLKGRPKPISPCSVLTQAEVEAILGTALAKAPEEDKSVCTYTLPPLPDVPPRIYDLQFFWSGGNYRLRQDLSAAKMGGAALGSMSMTVKEDVQVSDAPPKSVPGSGPAPPVGTHTVSENVTTTVDEVAKQMSGQTFSKQMKLTGEEDAAGTGPWERSATTGRSIEAVKKDVLVRGTWSADAGKARALVAAAIGKF
jgi:hypothetical protein